MKVGKRYAEASKVVKQKSFDVNGAFDALLSLPKAKFDETVELHVRLGVDGRNADQQRPDVELGILFLSAHHVPLHARRVDVYGRDGSVSFQRGWCGTRRDVSCSSGRQHPASCSEPLHGTHETR